MFVYLHRTVFTFLCLSLLLTIQVFVRSKLWMCGRCLVGIVVSNPAVCLLVSVVCFQVEISVTD
jgi:hypothetical protein